MQSNHKICALYMNRRQHHACAAFAIIFGQLEKPRADVMSQVNKKLSSLQPKMVKESRSSLDSRHY